MQLTQTLSFTLAVAALCATATAQRGSTGPTTTRLSEAQSNLLYGSSAGGAVHQLGGPRPAILLTGYWPPSNEAVRRFSTNPAQNPAGWIGSDWEGRGYDVYSYFPDFTPPTCTNCGIGTGDLTVDYQDTSADFWPIANALKPIAIITHSRGSAGTSWEAEMNQYNRSTWVNDYAAPLQPTPAPPDASVPANALRLSTLPVQEIVDNVLDANLGLNAFICFSGNGGGFLSEFIAYHGVWYQALHSSPSDPAWCIAGGHIHIGTSVPWATAERAARVTLRSVIHYVDTVRFGLCNDVDLYCQTSTNSVGPGAMLTTTGSSSIAANNLAWIVTGAPASVSSILFYGQGQMQNPFGNGKMCVVAPRTRVPPILTTDASGYGIKPVDLTIAPLGIGPYAVTAGTTWEFQAQYRDAPAGGANFNMTNGASVTFCP